MGFWSGTKKIFKPLVDVSTWLNLKQIRENGHSILQMAKDVFVPGKATRQETFEEAMNRLNLTEEDIKKRTIEFNRLIAIMLTLFFLIISYGIYLAWQGSWSGFLPCISMSLFVLGLAFRYHFWLFQIKQRKLGCTFREWLDSSFMEKS